MTYGCARCDVRWAADRAESTAKDCWMCGQRDQTMDALEMVKLAQRNRHDWADLVTELRESTC